MKILVTAPYNDQGLRELEEWFGDVEYRSWKPHGRAYNEMELMDMLRLSNADALITEHDDVTGNVIRAHPQLRFIGVCRGTPSNVDVKAASAHGIPVFNTPARNAQAVAELFIANIITFMRHTLPGIQWLKDGHWGEGSHTSYLQFKGNELAGKKVGMVGFGAVGQTIADMLKGFPCEIWYYDPFYTSSDADYRKVELEDLFAGCDIVAIHLPVTADTKGMIDKRYFSVMKRDAIFVNTARAIVVNRDDLLETIENNRIKGAILDVFNHEPPDEKDYRLIRHPNVLATPHIAGATDEVEDHHVRILNIALQQFFKQDKRDVKQWVNRGIENHKNRLG